MPCPTTLELIAQARKALAIAVQREDDADDAVLANPNPDERLRRASINAGHIRAQAEEDLSNLIAQRGRELKVDV